MNARQIAAKSQHWLQDAVTSRDAVDGNEELVLVYCVLSAVNSFERLSSSDKDVTELNDVLNNSKPSYFRRTIQ